MTLNIHVVITSTFFALELNIASNGKRQLANEQIQMHIFLEMETLHQKLLFEL